MKRVASLLPLLWGFTSLGQTNSWVSPADGNWQDVSAWSAGVLPGTNQTILITNAGSKTVRIGMDTAESYPGALRVESVTVSAPSNSLNALRLDAVGATSAFETSAMFIESGGRLEVLGSTIRARDLRVRGGAVIHGTGTLVVEGTLNQSGGVADLAVLLRNGDYNLSGGLRSGHTQLEGQWSSHLVQTGGTNIGTITITPSYRYLDDPESSYTLQAGEVRSKSLVIGVKGSFVQSGGVHYNESLTITPGYLWPRNSPRRRPEPQYVWGRYFLEGGVFLSLNFAPGRGFSQTGGTLKADNLTVNPQFWAGGGEIIVTNIILNGAFVDSPATTIRHHGSVHLGASGSWSPRGGERHLGPLQIPAGHSHWGGIQFDGESTSTLHFADSREMAWASEAKLVIVNWRGSFAGGGTHQLRFGTDANSLTAAQVRQIEFRFYDRFGLSHSCPAKILPDGEVVPVPTGIVMENRSEGLRLFWPPGVTLQTSTNVNGPFEDLADALSGSPMRFIDPARFFRIRPDAQ